jgi:rSAM-associated Gly-rich repeat protein
MSHLSRRQLLAGFLGSLVPAAGMVVLARAVLSGAVAEAGEADAPPPSTASLRERADHVAAKRGPLEEDEDFQLTSFVNGGFRNGGGGAFRKGGFGNGGGGFRNGGFGNGGGGAFRKGGFGNGGGGFGNGGFANGAFRN